MDLQVLKNKKVLILGFGREGMDNLKFLRKLFPKTTTRPPHPPARFANGPLVLGVGDRLEFAKLSGEAQKLILSEKCSRTIKLHLGKDYLKAIKNYGVIIKSPGVPPKILKPFLKKGQKITSQTEIFLENCPGKIIGITGTKGKSTTSSLIYRILKEGGIRAHLVGNIGKPVLQLLFSATSRDVYVYELSSHQLFNIKKSPHIAVFLNIYPEHLDYYKNFNEYIRAKANITRYQTKKDYLVFNSRDKIVREIAEKSKARKIPINKCLKRSFKQEGIPLIGDFNLQNLAAAIEVGKIFGVSEKDITKAIKKFKPLPHRLEFVGKFSGIKFYNDSLSTIPEATIAAIDTLEKNLQTIILGGFDRGQNFKKLAKKILESKIKTVILFPDTGKRIWRQIQKSARGPTHGNKLKCFFVDNMKEAVKFCYQNTKKGKVCLLSPAAASFNHFKNYRERGNLFKREVKLLGKNK